MAGKRCMSYRPLLLEALRRIEQAGRLAVANGGRVPIIIVGGLAVELHTGGELISSDIDLCEAGDELEAALLEVGFNREDRRGKIAAWVLHDDTLWRDRRRDGIRAAV